MALTKITKAMMADESIDSDNYVDGSIDNAHIADDAIDSEHYAAGSIDEAHIADNAVSLAKMAGGTDGQIITWDASGDPVAVGPGTDGQVLTSTGAGSPPAFEAAAGGGKLLTCVQSVKTDVNSTTSTTPVDTGLAVTTGTLTTGSKVLVQVSAHFGNSTAEQRTHITLWNGVTQLFLGDAPSAGHRVSSWFRSMDAYSIYNVSFMYLHSPGVTTAQTYTLKFHRSVNTSYTSWINRGNDEDANSGRAASSMTAMEIGV